MAVNSLRIHRPSDRPLYLFAAIAFPLAVLIGYFKSYYFSVFFSDARPIANSLVHFHGIVMTAWVVYFVSQVALVRTKNIKLHITMGFAGIALAALVVIVGLLTAYDSHLVRKVAPPGFNPFGFTILPGWDLLLFVLFFAAAIYYRKKSAEHKSLMLLTAINFMPAALFRFPMIPPDLMIVWAFGVPAALAVSALVWHSVRHRKLNRVFATGVLILLVSIPIRLTLIGSPAYIAFIGQFAP